MSYTKRLSKSQYNDLEMFYIGAYAPLKGFVNRIDYNSILQHMRLNDGNVWSIPIALSIDEEEYSRLKKREILYLEYEPEPEFKAYVEIEEIYKYDKEYEAQKIFQTTDPKHPGVYKLYQQGDYYVAGNINIESFPEHKKFKKYYLTPADTKRIFHERGWQRIVAFQTRNPIHRAHEYLQKCALEICDGIFIHPIVGETKKDDIPAEIRFKCYEVLIEKYYPKNRVLLGINPAFMRYAGPREAVFHALIRRNYGCTHIIIGRDHAGVGNYYGPYDAQKIFDNFSIDELGIEPLFFENSFWCKRCEGMATLKTCPHDEREHLSLSGTKVRELLSSGQMPPQEITRPEVAKILIDWWTKT